MYIDPMFVALRPPAEKPRRIGFVRSRWAAVVAGQEKRRAAIRSKHASTVMTPIPKVQVSNQLPEMFYQAEGERNVREGSPPVSPPSVQRRSASAMARTFLT